jgi:hypothetical protein
LGAAIYLYPVPRPPPPPPQGRSTAELATNRLNASTSLRANKDVLRGAPVAAIGCWEALAVSKELGVARNASTCPKQHNITLKYSDKSVTVP